MNTLQYNSVLEKIQSFNYIVIDSSIMRHYPDIKKILEGKVVFQLSNPEDQKTIRDFERAVDFFLEQSITRSDSLLSIGGGATSDFAGFVAASLLRGLAWEVVPTTLLAMIDASIGGKTGLNSTYGKNLIGAFHRPCQIHLCEAFLNSLPSLELQSGMGELVKYAFLEQGIYESILEKKSLEHIIKECALYKQSIVDEDYKETGIRKSLNLGHTLGHALERVLNIPHGIAVAWGILFMIETFSPSLKPSFFKILKHLNFELPSLDKFSFEEVYFFLKNDKKRTNDNKINLVIPIKIGDVVIKELTTEKLKQQLETNELFTSYLK